MSASFPLGLKAILRLVFAKYRETSNMSLKDVEVHTENLCSAAHSVWSHMSTSVGVILTDHVYDQI